VDEPNDPYHADHKLTLPDVVRGDEFLPLGVTWCCDVANRIPVGLQDVDEIRAHFWVVSVVKYHSRNLVDLAEVKDPSQQEKIERLNIFDADRHKLDQLSKIFIDFKIKHELECRKSENQDCEQYHKYNLCGHRISIRATSSSINIDETFIIWEVAGFQIEESIHDVEDIQDEHQHVYLVRRFGDVSCETVLFHLNGFSFEKV
jgi:hypothetical protein